LSGAATKEYRGRRHFGAEETTMATPPEGGIPTGIQRLVRRAAVDEAFHRALLDSPAAVAATDPELTPRERAVLAAVPPTQLAAMVAAVRPAAGVDRRAFVRASSAVLLLGGVALSACPTLTCGGIGPDVPPSDAGTPDAGTPDAGTPDAPGSLVILTGSLPDAVIGQYYSEQIRIRGGGSFFEFEIISQSLPDGLHLDLSGGLIYGTPTHAGQFDFSLRVTSDDQQTAMVALTIRVSEVVDGGADDGAGDASPTDGSTGDV
jgi:hypothetical protein